MRAIAEHGIAPIDMVVVNLYRFEEVAAKAGARLEELIENIDIGGPTMIRAAAKNYQDVAVVRLARGLRRASSKNCARRRRAFARDHVAAGAEGLPHHRRLRLAPSARAWRRVDERRRRCPPTLDMRAPKLMDLRYGENPHQSAALYGRRGAGIAGAEQLHGKELSYNNLVDLDAAWQLVCEFARPGVGHHQAHQSVRLRRAGDAGRGLPQGVRMPIRCRPSAACIGFNRDRGRGDGARDRQDVHRSDRRARLFRGSARRPRRARRICA